MTRQEAYLKLQEMPDYSGMHKVLKKGCWDTINDEDWYVDYVENISMSGGRRIIAATPVRHMQTVPVNNINLGQDINIAMTKCIYGDSDISYSGSGRHYLLSDDMDNIPLNVWLKAGVPPNGRTKKQHILIQQLNKKKKGR